jgi:hypothetical protein
LFERYGHRAEISWVPVPKMTLQYIIEKTCTERLMQKSEAVILPNFFLVGAAKAGTTSLARYLSQHPDIFIPELKEPKYFSIQDKYFPHRGPLDELVDAQIVRDLDSYVRLYSSAAHVKARGDASIDYLFYEKVPARIHALIPDAKILIVLRNPVDRAFSSYVHMVRDGRENLSFEDAIAAEARRRGDNWEFFWQYVELGMYFQQVKRYLDIFGKEQVMILLYDQLVNDPAVFCRTIFSFLDVDTACQVDVSQKHNVSGIPTNRIMYNLFNRKNILKSLFRNFIPAPIRKTMKAGCSRLDKKIAINATTRSELLNLYASDIRKLEELLAVDLHIWLQ